MQYQARTADLAAGSLTASLAEAPLSPALQGIVRTLRAERHALSDRMLDTLRQTIPEYHSLRDDVARDVFDAGVRNAELWYDALAACHMPPPDGLEWVADFGRRRCEQGVTLAALLHAYRIGTRVYLDTLISRVHTEPAVAHEVLLKVSPFVLGYGDLLSQTISEVYLDQRVGEARHRDRLREDLFGIVCHQPQLDAAFDDAARALGLDPQAAHHALVLRPIDAAPQPHRFDALREQLLSLPGICSVREPLWGVTRGQLALWLDVGADEASSAREHRLADTLASLLRDAALPVQIGIGAPASGARGWHHSLEQAAQAVDLGQRLRPERRLHFYSSVALDATVTASPEMVASLQELIDRLAAEPQLLETLQAYFDQRQQLKAVAAVLGIHRNTLLHRLERIRTLLHADLADMGWLARLHLALRQRQLRVPRSGGN